MLFYLFSSAELSLVSDKKRVTLHLTLDDEHVSLK